MRLHVADHPLVSHKLTALRDERTDSPTFRRLADELVTLLAYEATREVRTEAVDIRTPVGPTTGVKLSSPKPLVVPILRAGLGMLDGVLDMVPNAKVSVVGLSRNHETLQPEHYFERFVGHLDERTALIVDPMLATAGSMIATIDLLKSRGCKDVRALVLVAAPEGIAALAQAHPDVRCWTAAVDSHLNEVGYIIPGLGDAGDKIFGTK
jgi:uracil phosphoribosyltransferase